jgi:hypothetical protein
MPSYTKRSGCGVSTKKPVSGLPPTIQYITEKPQRGALGSSNSVLYFITGLITAFQILIYSNLVKSIFEDTLN